MMKHSTLLTVLQLLSVYFDHLSKFFGDDDSLIPLLICCRQLLIIHVLFALHVVVSDVHHKTFMDIETPVPLVGRLNKFIDIFL